MRKILKIQQKLVYILEKQSVEKDYYFFSLRSLKGMLKRIKIAIKNSMKKRTGEFEKEQNGMLEIRSMVIIILKHWLDRLLLELRKKLVN